MICFEFRSKCFKHNMTIRYFRFQVNRSHFQEGFLLFWRSSCCPGKHIELSFSYFLGGTLYISCLPHRTQNRTEQWFAFLLIISARGMSRDGPQILSLSLTFSSFSKINTCTTPEFKCLHRIGRRYGIFSKTICFGQLPTQFLGPGIQNLKTRQNGQSSKFEQSSLKSLIMGWLANCKLCVRVPTANTPLCLTFPNSPPGVLTPSHTTNT